MYNFLEKVKFYLKIALDKGFSYIVISSILNKVFVLASTIALNRLLSPADYGFYSYAYNIISIITVVSSLGVDVALLQFCSEKRNEKEKYSIQKYALFIGLISNCCFALITFLISLLFASKLPEAMKILSSLSFLYPLPFIVSFCSMVLRSKLDNKKYSILTNVSSLSYLIFLIALTLMLGIKGAVLGRYLGYVIPALVGLLFLGDFKHNLIDAHSLNTSLKKEFLSYGLIVTLTNSVSSLLYYIDIHVVGLVTNNALSIASYKTATIIPNALAAIPTIIVTFIYPYFAKNKDNPAWVINRTKTIQAFVFSVSLTIAAILCVFAPGILTLIFGKQYLSSVIPFRILLISFVVSGSFRVISGNIIAMLGKVKANFYIGLVTCILNVVLDYIFIKNWGSVGAAIATTIIMVVAAVLSNYYLYRIYGNTR